MSDNLRTTCICPEGDVEVNGESAAHRYLNAAIDILRRIAEEESATLDQLGEKIADIVAGSGRLFVFGAGHSALAAQEIVYRAGGLMLVNPLLAPGVDSINVRPVTLGSQLERLPGYGTAVVDESPLHSGDVLVVISLSGRNAMPVQVARRARELGATVVAVTSSAYSDVPTREPGGERLVDLADTILDTKVPLGDAVLTADGVPQPFGPASGVAANAMVQALVVAIIDGMLARGMTPPVLLSANIDGGAEWNEKLLAEHKDRIFYLD